VLQDAANFAGGKIRQSVAAGRNGVRQNTGGNRNCEYE
jgi:hypothetical protein